MTIKTGQTPMAPDRPRSPERIIRLRPRRIAQTFGVAAGFAVGVAGLFVEEMSDWIRYGLALGALTLVAIGARASWLTQNDAERLSVEKQAIMRELEELKTRFAGIGVDTVLRSLAGPLFIGSAGWRLTVYLLEEDGGEWWLNRRARVSSAPRFEKSGRARFRLEHSLVRGLDLHDLSGRTSPYAGESGELPSTDSVQTREEWLRLQAGVLGDSKVAESLTMPSRKYAWCAAREEDGTRRVVVMMAESVDPAGINVGVLQARTTPALLGMLARLSDLPAELATAIDEKANALGLSAPR